MLGIGPMSVASARRVAMVSGANRGIGAAIATRLSAEGWSLSLGVRSPDAERDPPKGHDMLVHGYDARDRGSERRWVDATAERFGRIDAVVANAGILFQKASSRLAIPKSTMCSR
jgi:NAD(P)-dependent dehydrogenase (short-subunit alcohol dehydrogenase family)